MNPSLPALDGRVIAEILDRLRAADHVIIGAGAGLSIEAGIDFGSQARFARRFPAMLQYGFSSELEVMHFDAPDPALTWGYLADHVYAVRWETPPGEVYTQLLELVKEKDYFVITSNVDAQFPRARCDEQRLYTPQGDYALLQCLKPCTRAVWPSRPIIDAILPTIDRKTQTITDRSVILFCPACGGSVFMNVRGGPWFIEEHVEDQRERFRAFVQGSTIGSLLLVELGSGFNTPGVIRWPLENVTHRHPDAHLVRVNPAHPGVPRELAGRATAINSGARVFVEAMSASVRGA